MTLHQTTEIGKKIFIGLGIGTVGLIILTVLFRVGLFAKELIFPPKITPPNTVYGVLPPITFPQNAGSSDVTYTLNTLTGTLPTFPSRLNIYPIKQNEPNFLNLNKAKTKVSAIGMLGPAGAPLQDQPLGGALYQWTEPTNLRRKMTYNIVDFDFSLQSQFLSSLTVLGAQHLSDEKNAIGSAKLFLTILNQFTPDIDMTKTETPLKDLHYLTGPQLFSIQNSTLVPATSLSKADIIRVDFYQKDIAYDLNTGIPEAAGGSKIEKVTLPILYPHPPYSTMNFLVGSGISGPQVVAGEYVHKDIVLPTATEIAATYPIKTAQVAFDELQTGKGYIAAYSGSESEILINNIFLAYYLGDQPQQYLMPVIVFEGEGGFFAYVSALKAEWVQ